LRRYKKLRFDKKSSFIKPGDFGYLMNGGIPHERRGHCWKSKTKKRGQGRRRSSVSWSQHYWPNVETSALTKRAAFDKKISLNQIGRF
jgi:hypothetical protein